MIPSKKYILLHLHTYTWDKYITFPKIVIVLLIILAKQRLPTIYENYVVMVVSKYLLFHAIYDSYVVMAISKYLLFHD